MLLLETMDLTLTDIETVLGAQANLDSKRNCSLTISGVSTDSRTIHQGEIFFALKGDNFDGHDFIEQAFANGAVAAVVDRDIDYHSGIIIRVADTLKALGDLAQSYRKRFDIICVAITGSNGKTTTKEMTACCLESRYSVLKTLGNLNNLIGLPQNLFRLEDHHQVGVFELGMSFPGEIARLAQICEPKIGVFTNIAPVHLENMKTIEAIAAAKHELMENLAVDGLAIINSDDPILRTWIGREQRKIVTYAIDSAADYRAERIRQSEQGNEFYVAGVKFAISHIGRHNIYNALAAIACADQFGCGLESSANALAKLQPGNLRSDVFRNHGITIIDDCYNANPVSMKLAIDTLASYPAKGKKIAVLADMLELGEHEIEFHQDIGRHLNRTGIDALFAYGKLAKNYLSDFHGSVSAHYDEKEMLISDLLNYMKKGDVVLVKGSRGMALEQISKRLRGMH